MYNVLAVFNAIDNISRTANAIARNTEIMGSRVQKVSAVLQGVGTAMTKYITLPLLAMGAAAVVMSVRFDKAMMGVNSVLKLSGAEFKNLSDEVLEFSTTTSKSSEDVALALRGIVSSGFESADAMTVLRVAVDAAGNMMASTETTTRALTSTLRAFGMEAEDVTHVADVLETMANKSSVTFEALTASIGEAVGMAAAANVPFETMAAAIMTVSDAGYSVSESSIAVRNLIQEMLNPTEDLSDAIRGWGYSSGEAALASLGLEGVLQKLRETTGGSAAEIMNLLGNVRAGKAAFALMRGEGLAFADSLDEVADASKGVGEHEAMRAVRHQSAAYQMAKLKSEVEVLAIRLGNVLLPSIIDIVQGLTQLFTALAQADEKTIKFAVGVALAIAAIGPFLKITGLLITAYTTLAPIVVTAAVGMELYAEGATVAQLASLGLTAALGPILIALAALAGAAIAAYMAVKLLKEIEERTAEVTNTWTDFLEKQADTAGNAVLLANEFADAQISVNKAYEDGGIVAQIFIDKQKMMNANAQDLNRALLKASTSYDNYLAGVNRVNKAILAQGRGHGELVQSISRSTYEVNRARDADVAMASSALEAVSATEELAAAGGALEEQMWGAQERIGAVTDALKEAGAESRLVAEVQREMALGLGELTALESMQKDALVLLSAATMDQRLSQEEYIEIAMQVLDVNQDNVEGYLAVFDAMGIATEGYEGLRSSAETLPSAIHAVAAATQRAAEVAAEMAIKQKEAWDTFAGSVRTAVGQALEAYRTGNAEMLAEQQAALGQMLYNQTETMLGLGQITEDQAMAMKTAIVGEYGIVVDETSIATGHLLALFGDWSTGGETTATEIIGFLQNIGTETAALVTSEEESIAADLLAWQNLNDERETLAGLEKTRLATIEGYVGAFAVVNQTETGNVSDYWNNTSDTVSATESAWDKSMWEMQSSMSTMQKQVYTDSIAAVSSIDDVGGAIDRLPSVHTIKINVEVNAPEGFEMNSPQFKFQTALGKLRDFARMNRIQIGVSADGGGSIPIPVGRDGRSSGDTTESYDQRKYESNVTINSSALGSMLEAASRQL